MDAPRGWASRMFVHVLPLMAMLFVSSESMTVSENGTFVLDDGSEYVIDFQPREIHDLFVGESEAVRFNVTQVGFGLTADGSVDKNVQDRNYATDIFIGVDSDDSHIANITTESQFSLASILSQDNNSPLNESLHFIVEGLFLGRTRLNFFINATTYTSKSSNTSVPVTDIPEKSKTLLSLQSFGGFNSDSESTPHYYTTENSTWKQLPFLYKASVIRKERILDKMFIAVVSILVFCGNIGMGCKVDLDVVKEVIRRPIAPSIGFASQYIIMPLTSFAVVKLLKLEGGLALGLFALGCSPGGTTSNIYTFMLNGDVSLSITMTLISTLASLGMMPFWLYTLGRLITGRDANLHLPIQNIFISLVSLLIPVAIGIIIGKKKPRAAEILVKCLKPFYVVLVLFMFTFGIYTNVYIFKLITPVLCVAGCLVPYVGFSLGGLAAFAARQPFKRIYTIAIETGLQNTGIPIILMKFSLDQPEGDMSIVSPIVTSMFGPIPLWIAVVAYEIHKCRKKKKGQDDAVCPEDLNNAGVRDDSVVDDDDEDAEKELISSAEDINLNSLGSARNGSHDPSGKLVVMFNNDNKLKS